MKSSKMGILLVLAWTAWPAAAQSGSCGALENHYGPYDYSDAAQRRDKLPIVERFHFNADVEGLVRGITSENVLGDLDYTLRTFPNHHRALNAVARYELRGGKPGEYLTAECYFDRALRFRPRDGMVHLIYGIYLHRKGQLPAAQERYEYAIAVLPDNAEAHYNLGLLFVDTKAYDKARKHALEAYRLGYPLEGLKRKLARVGAWQAADPAPAPATSSR
jgi:tetratricopeptide (TPR) repeat protein